MQVYRVGLGGGIAFAQNASAVDAEAHFGDGIGAHEQAAPGRNFWIALRQQYGDPGQRKPQKISTTIAQENFAAWPVDHKKPQYGGGDHQAGEGQGNIVHLAGNQAEGSQHDEGYPCGQSVEAVDDVNGIGHPPHSKGSKQHRDGGKAQ